MAYSDRELLARLIQCEAGGEGEDGMKAVAGVVMNRVRQGRGVCPGRAGQHPQYHLSALSVRLRQRDGGRRLQPPEYLQHETRTDPL